jgi:hypothetical protein
MHMPVVAEWQDVTANGLADPIFPPILSSLHLGLPIPKIIVSVLWEVLFDHQMEGKSTACSLVEVPSEHMFHSDKNGRFL